MAEERREVQRRPPVGAVRVDCRCVPAAFEQPLHVLQFPGCAGLEDRQRRAARDQQVHNFLLTMIDSG